MLPSDPEHDQFDDGLISENNDDLALDEIPEDDIQEVIEDSPNAESSTISDVEMEGPEDGPGIGELCLHEGDPAYSLALHPNKGLVASGGGNDRVVIFRVHLDYERKVSVDIIEELEGHGDTVEHVKFSSKGEYLATGSLDGTVRVYQIQGEKALFLHQLDGPSEVSWLDWHPQDGRLAAGSGDGSIWVWDGTTGECQSVLLGKATNSSCGKFTMDGKFLASCALGTVFIWDLSKPTDSPASLTYSGGNLPQGDALTVAIHPSQPVVAVGFDDGHLLLLHLLHHQIVAKLRPSSESIEQVLFMPGHPIMVVASLDGSITIIDSNTFKVRATLKEEQLVGGISALTLVDDGKTLVGGSVNGAIGMWDVRSGQLKQVIYAPGGKDAVEENAIYDFLELTDARLILVSYDDGKIRLFNY